MKKPAVSVIIPCYNRERFIADCVNSISKQSLEEIEIIFVDDGSSDNSLSIVENLHKKDSRIRIIGQPNLGVATARNTGLKHATAPYIMWCDSDDFYDEKMCERMLATIKQEKVDIVACGMKLVYTDDSNQKDIEDYVKLKFDGKQKLDFHHILQTDVSLPTKIFKKSLIDKYKMSFPDGLHFEDAFFCDQYFSMANSIYYLNEKLYSYVRHEDSIMSKSFKKEPISLDYIKIIPRTLTFLEQNNAFEKNVDFFWHRFIQYYAFTYDNAAKSKQGYVQKWALDFIKDHAAEFDPASEHIKHDLLALIHRRKTWKSRLYSNALVRYTWETLKPLIRR